MQIDRPVRYLPLQQRFTSGSGGNPTPCLANPTPGCTHNNPNWGPLIPAGTPVFDIGRLLYDTGRMMDNTLTMSGGTEATTFFLSAGALSHDGFVSGDSDQFKRYTVRLNAGHAVRSNLRVGGNIAYAQTEGASWTVATRRTPSSCRRSVRRPTSTIGSISMTRSGSTGAIVSRCPGAGPGARPRLGQPVLRVRTTTRIPRRRAGSTAT
jgi:hypothetical protein